jgi:hypothetical protein
MERAAESNESDDAIALLGLDGSEPTARYRILFVFHSLNANPVPPAAPAAGSPEPKK